MASEGFKDQKKMENMHVFMKLDVGLQWFELL